MGRVQASMAYPTTVVSAAEELWYDPVRWPSFVDGFGHVSKLEGDWPKPGAVVVWDSPPGGRERVIERVERYEARVGQTLAVEDNRLRGTQRVAFQPGSEGVTVTLALDYELKDARLRVLVDALFVRRALRDSLRRTLRRFGRELAADRELLR